MLVGGICAYAPREATWIDADGRGEVLMALRVAEPIFFPADLLVLDGDVSNEPASRRFELMRALVPIVGSHIIVPPQTAVSPRQDLSAAVDEGEEWAPSERGETWKSPGVTVVRADSKYTHGESRDEVRLSRETQKEFAF